MPPTQAAWLLTGGSTLSAFIVALLLVRVLRSPVLPMGLDPDSSLKFAEGERDRLQAVAKGMAASSSGFLVALITALVAGSISEQASPCDLVCVLLGAVGMLLLAAAQSKASAEYMAAAVAAYPVQPVNPGPPPSG